MEEFTENVKNFLQVDVECHFNWNLEELDTEYFPVLECFEAKLRHKDLIVETPLVQKWTLKLSYGYEMFKKDKNSGVDVVKEAVDEMASTTDDLFVKYKVAFQHLACSLLAKMLLETYSPSQETDQRQLFTKQVHMTLLKVTAFNNLSDIEKSGVLGLKAHVLRWYGADGTKAAIPVITEASCLCPEELEWKISRVITLTRMRNFNPGQSITWADVAVPMEILTELVESQAVTGDQEMVCKYFLARTHRDMIVMYEGDPEQKEKSSTELKRLCTEIHQSKTTSPQVVSFVAQQLARYGQLDLGINMIKRALEIFPQHIGLNTTICNLYKMARKFEMVRYHSKIAMDEGGYGASWIYFEYAIRARLYLNYEEFFNKLLNQHPYSFKAKTHVQASIFYYFHKKNILRGSDHIKSALESDPTYDGLKNTFCKWVRRRVNPLEIAYNQIHVYLRKQSITYRDEKILKEVREAISSHTDVTNFATSKDMVNDMWHELQRPKRHKNSASSASELEEQ